jgi:hypothetical protein
VRWWSHAQVSHETTTDLTELATGHRCQPARRSARRIDPRRSSQPLTEAHHHGTRAGRRYRAGLRPHGPHRLPAGLEPEVATVAEAGASPSWWTFDLCRALRAQGRSSNTLLSHCRTSSCERRSMGTASLAESSGSPPREAARCHLIGCSRGDAATSCGQTNTEPLGYTGGWSG